jgi:hypothetical protein
MRVVRGLSDKFVRTRCFSVSAAETAKVRFPVARRAIPKLERHSIPMQHQYSSLTVFTVPVLADAYSYIVFDHHSKEAALIDPCEPELVIKTCERFAMTNVGVLCFSFFFFFFFFFLFQETRSRSLVC